MTLSQLRGTLTKCKAISWMGFEVKKRMLDKTKDIRVNYGLLVNYNVSILVH